MRACHSGLTDLHAVGPFRAGAALPRGVLGTISLAVADGQGWSVLVLRVPLYVLLLWCSVFPGVG